MTVVPLDTRRVTLGGSTIAAAAGIDPWCSRVELFYRMTGVLPEPETEAAWWGEQVQPVIFDALRARDIAAHETTGVEVTHDTWPWYVGHPDGLTDDDELVEAKLTGGYAYRHGEALPVQWQAQVQTYMHACQCERTLVAVNVGGTRLDVVPVEYDERAAERLMALGEAFIAHVRSDTPPPPDGSDSARQTLAHVFPQQTPGERYRLLGEQWQWGLALREWREVAERADERAQEYENRIKQAAGAAETIITPHDTTFATWKTVTSRRLDAKRVRAEYPHVFDVCAADTTTRRFVLT